MKEGPLMVVPPEQISESVPDVVSVRIAHRLRRTLDATRELLRRVRHAIAIGGRGRHSAVYVATRPARTPVPPPTPVAVESSAPSAPSPASYEDPPTLRLPRIPAAERFPILWDFDPVGLYVVQYERERALGVAR